MTISQSCAVRIGHGGLLHSTRYLVVILDLDELVGQLTSSSRVA